VQSTDKNNSNYCLIFILRFREEGSTREVLLVNTRVGRSHHLLTRETLKVPRVGACAVLGEEVVTVSSGRAADTWITSYQ